MLRATLFIGFCFLCAQYAFAQDTAEYGAAAANAGTVVQNAPRPAPDLQSSATHLPVKTGPAPQEVNRKEFEDNAGAKAGKIFFRSAPNGADVFLNDLLIGQTPLLVLLAPGKYRVYMRGPREESGRRDIGVLPSRTETVSINLSQKYPAAVSIR
jgi:PEGA domain